jgi:ribonuclease P protein component
MAGKTVARTSHFALHCAALNSEPAAEPTGPGQPLFAQQAVWMGAMVPKRWARRAVTRNTIKRQIYSVSAHYEDRLQCCAYVVRLRSEYSRKVFVSATSDALRQAVRTELQALFGSISPAVTGVAGK